MARYLDDPPIYDRFVSQDGKHMSSVFQDWMAANFETMIGYLSQYGIFIPIVTTAQRDSIQSPVEGQMIYNVDAVVGPPRTAAIQVWQVKADVGAWYTFTTT